VKLIFKSILLGLVGTIGVTSLVLLLAWIASISIIGKIIGICLFALFCIAALSYSIYALLEQNENLRKSKRQNDTLRIASLGAIQYAVQSDTASVVEFLEGISPEEKNDKRFSEEV
jgi:hypothetical protein